MVYYKSNHIIYDNQDLLLTTLLPTEDPSVGNHPQIADSAAPSNRERTIWACTNTIRYVYSSIRNGRYR